MVQPDPKRKKEILTLVTVFVLVLGLSALVVYLVAAKKASNEAARSTTPPAVVAQTPDGRQNPPVAGANGTIIDELFGASANGPVVRHESVGEAAAAITVRLLLAALLGAALAFRPRRRLRALKRNPFVGQTQILLAVVAAALMIIVGDNAARAFGIFAAVSLVRFRTNIRDPKEVTVLLISLAVGLGAGVGRWELSLILTFFSLLVLWLLEHKEAEQVSRAMELTVTTREVAATQIVLRKILGQHDFVAEIRAIKRETSKEPLGSLTYQVDVNPVVTTDEISAEILGLDSANVAGIEWKQTKSFPNMYQ
ncbi:MAG TPA: DUF4956 domain-containing protein [Pyrinomonadaceae bacterium]|nr:DUF4956 domain-containing protein [Pyrinomonadaceae bacterium]